MMILILWGFGFEYRLGAVIDPIHLQLLHFRCSNDTSDLNFRLTILKTEGVKQLLKLHMSEPNVAMRIADIQKLNKA